MPGDVGIIIALLFVVIAFVFLFANLIVGFVRKKRRIKEVTLNAEEVVEAIRNRQKPS